MFKKRFFKNIFHRRFEDLDQVRLVYALSLFAGLLSAGMLLTLLFVKYVVREIMFNQDLYDKICVKDLLTIPPSYIDKKENIETVMETFRKSGAWNLAVLSDGYYVGFISKSRIYTTYRELLIQFSEE